MTMTYPHISDTVQTNPAVAAAYSYKQDDGFGNLIDTVDLCMDDGDRTCYLYAFIERDHLMIYNPLFYGIH